MTRHRVEVAGGAALHVEEDGDGPPLLLVNGAFCNVRQWDRALPVLAKRFRVIRHDVRGTGRSTAGDPALYCFEQYADDIVAILDQLRAPRTALWGMAWGARVALVAAARHEDRFTRVVLSDLAIDPADTDAQRAGAKTAARARADAGIEAIPRPEGFAEHADPEEAGRALAAAAKHPDLMPFVREVTLPVLLATGEHDPNLTSTQRALAGFADAHLEVLPHTGHGSVLQRPDLVNETVIPFLSAVVPS